MKAQMDGILWTDSRRPERVEFLEYFVHVHSECHPPELPRSPSKLLEYPHSQDSSVNDRLDALGELPPRRLAVRPTYH